MLTKLKKLNTEKNIKDLLSIRNKIYVRENSINKKKISLEVHKKWFNSFIQKKRNRIYGLFFKNNLIGFISIDVRKKNKVSWNLKKNYWGKVNFYKFLKNVTKIGKYTANIKIDNISSLIIALKSGFRIFKTKKKYCLFKKIKIFNFKFGYYRK